MPTKSEDRDLYIGKVSTQDSELPLIMQLQKFFKISEDYAKAIIKTLLRQKMEYKFKMSLVKVHIQVAIAPYSDTLTL